MLLGFWKSSNRKVNIVAKSISVTIIIPFRNEILRWNKLLRCLEFLDNSSCELKILFIDDHSNDGGAEHLKF